MSNSNETNTQKTEWQLAMEAARAATMSDVAKPLADSRIKQGVVVASLVGIGAALHAALS